MVYAESAFSKNIRTLIGGGNSTTQTGGASSSFFKQNLDDLFKLIVAKKQFFIMIFANLIVQLGITYYVMEKINIDPNNKYNTKMYRILGVVILLCLVIIIGVVPMPSWFKFILFCIFSSIWGYLLSKLRVIFGEDTIKMAMVGTISIFALMFTFGVGLILSGIQLGLKFGLILFCALLFLLIVRITQIFIPTSSLIKKFIIIFGLVLFSVYIVYDTNTILQRNHYYGDFITASMDYYLDILNIFTKLLYLGK
jgi:FtsH-binding integral membrane protein